LHEVLDTTVAQLGELLHHDCLAILLLGDTDEAWHTVRREGMRVPGQLTTAELPGPLDRALRARSVISEPDLSAHGGPGLSQDAGSGLYAVLPARGSVIGLVAVEHRSPHHFEQSDLEILAGFVDAAALAI